MESEESLTTEPKDQETTEEPEEAPIITNAATPVTVVTPFSSETEESEMTYQTLLEPAYADLLHMATEDEYGEHIKGPMTPEEIKARMDRVNKAKILFEHGLSRIEEFITEVTPFNILGVSSKLTSNSLFDEFMEEEFAGGDTSVTPVLSIPYQHTDSKATRLFKLYVNELITAALTRQSVAIEDRRRAIVESKKVIELEAQVTQMNEEMRQMREVIVGMAMHGLKPSAAKRSAKTPPKTLPKASPPKVSASPPKKETKKVPKARARRLKSLKERIKNKV